MNRPAMAPRPVSTEHRAGFRLVVRSPHRRCLVITAMPRIAIAVQDFDAAVKIFREAFGMPVADFSDTTVPSLGAHVGMCAPEGGSNIELMAPANPDMALSQSIQKFLDQRGEGFYALMLEAPDPDAEAEILSGRGLSVLPLMKGAGGRDVHPRSTHGVLIRVYPNDSAPPPDEVVSGAPELSGIARVIIATTDAAKAAEAYGHGFGLEVDAPVNDEERGIQQVLCRPPKGGVIELVSTLDTTKPFARDIELFLKEKNEGIYAFVLHADDPKAAAVFLQDNGVSVGGTTGLEASVFGARLLIE
jgi:catechol 2,3-dioxygenase-like lactoylglutathione lyase family enzyme